MFDEEVFTFIWSIRKFSMCPVGVGDFISSPIITISNYGNSEWCLVLYPKGIKTEDYIACYLRCVNLGNDGNPISLKFSLSVSSFEKQAEYAFKLNGAWGCPEFILMKDILSDKNKYLPNDTLTIKCTMKCKDFVSKKSIGKEISETNSRVSRNSNLNIDRCYIETTIPVETKSFVWSIEKFQSLLCNKGLTLPVFSAMKDFPSFYVTVYKISESPIRIEIKRKENDYSTYVFVKCIVSVINTEKDVKHFAEDSYLFKSVKEEWNFPPFLLLSDLDEYFESTDGILYLQFDFTFSIDIRCHSEKSFCDPLFLPTKSQPPMKLFTELRNEQSVVTLKVEHHTFKVHRSLLESKSEVFQKMFESDMIEKQTGIVDITDVAPHTVAQMLQFIYFNTVDDLSQIDAAKLYAFGDKYQIKSLASHCSSVLVSLMSASNVCDILDLADLHCDQRLQKYAHDFVEANCDDILVSREWADFMERSGTLAAKILHKILTK